MIDLLNNAIAEIDALEDKAPHKVLLGKKWYTTVPTRINIFRKHFGLNAKILTDVSFVDNTRVEVHASIQVIRDGSWETIATGLAEEYRGQGMVNKTSALENCETSSIGRALANLGMHGGEYASSFEVDNAKNNKEEAPSGYVIKGSKGSVIGNSPTPDTFFAQFKIMVSKPENSTCKKVYELNTNEVHRAYQDAVSSKLAETVEGLREIMAAYNDDFVLETDGGDHA